MRVLVACEFSGRVRDAFTHRGHIAISCDLRSSLTPGRHHKGNVLDILADGWDMMIAFPPCTYLSKSSAELYNSRRLEQNAALEFVRQLLAAPIERIALENPVGKISTAIRKPDQIIQPYQHGDPYAKQTCLWLKNLPPLRASNWCIATKQWARVTRNAEQRSLTFPGIARAMADQWG